MIITEGKKRGGKLLTNCGEKHDNKASKHGNVISNPKREFKKRYSSNRHPYTWTVFFFHVRGKRNAVIWVHDKHVSECRYRGTVWRVNTYQQINKHAKITHGPGSKSCFPERIAWSECISLWNIRLIPNTTACPISTLTTFEPCSRALTYQQYTSDHWFFSWNSIVIIPLRKSKGHGISSTLCPLE